ncbi:MAG: monooxygenase FAD-binding protein [Microbacterium sp.]|nr:monooxygenase FAD-binding protein [Microbacterium sp.]
MTYENAPKPEHTPPRQHSPAGNTTPHVIVAGGGLAGLALAAGLRRRGIPVEVFEKDTDLRRTGGYHIHLDRQATTALGTLLDPRAFEEILASSATTRVQGGDVMRDMRGRELLRTAAVDDDGGVNIDRITLRLILARAAEESLTTGAVVAGYTRDQDGRVTVRLDDGGTRSADLLVGADGVHSVIATTLAGGSTNIPTGLLGIGGRTPASALPPRARAVFSTDSGLAIGPGGTGLYIGYHDPARHPAVDSPRIAAPVSAAATYIWGAVMSESADTDALRGLAAADLRDATLALLRGEGWTSPMLDVIAATDLPGLGTFRFHAGPSDVNLVAPWPAGPITALGDAVHAMPPTAGMGAATAIRDAADLASRLEDVRDGQVTIPVAVHDFEHGMRIRGAAAVAASMRPVGMIHATRTPLGRVAARAGLPLGAALQRLRGRRR